MTHFKLIRLSNYVLPSVSEVSATPHMTRLAYACVSWECGNYAEALAWILDWDELPQCVMVDSKKELAFFGFYLNDRSRSGWELGGLGGYTELRSAFEQFLLNVDHSEWSTSTLPDGAKLDKVHRSEWIRETRAF